MSAPLTIEEITACNLIRAFIRDMQCVIDIEGAIRSQQVLKSVNDAIAILGSCAEKIDRGDAI